MAKKKSAGKVKKKRPPAPKLSEIRGVGSFDTNEILVLVKAPLHDVSAAFKKHRKAKKHTKDALGTNLTIVDPMWVVYQIAGHPWVIIDLFIGSGNYPSEEDAQAISKALKTSAILYGNSDTAGVTVYELFDNGKSLERLETGDEGLSFNSTSRDIEAPEDGPDVHPFVDAFIKTQDAFCPSWTTYLGGICHNVGDKITLDFGGMFEDNVLSGLDLVFG